jgi:superfamily I DNA/RNA helicase
MYSLNTFFLDMRDYSKRLRGYGVEDGMACDNGVIPSPERLAEADLVAGIEEIYDTERNLLYVACTRARDYLLVTSAGVPSEFLLDMERL